MLAFFIFFYIIALYYIGLMFYILKGGQVYHAPPLFAIVAPSCDISGHVGTTSYLLVLSCKSLFRLRMLSIIWLRDWGGVRDSRDPGISQCAYLKRLIPEPSYHCGHWKLIMCAGNLYTRIHRCAACTKVMAILILM